MYPKYFQNFKKVYYRFGNNEAPALFTNISQYVDLIDQVKDRDIFLQDYTVLPNERPDQVAFKLYGRADWYWLFFLVNDDIRESGWPVPSTELLEIAQQWYPHRTVRFNIRQQDVVEFDAQDNPITRTKLVGTPPDLFPVGSLVTGSQSNTIGTIIKRDLSIGQMVIDTENASSERIQTRTINPNSNGIVEISVNIPQDFFVRPLAWSIEKNGIPLDGFDVEIDKLRQKATIRNIEYCPLSTYSLRFYFERFNLSDGTFIDGEEISYPNAIGQTTSLIVLEERPQYLSAHHWEDSDGNIVEIDALNQDVTGLNRITYFEMLERRNDELKKLKIIKPEAAEGIVKEFNELMGQ